MVMKSFSEKFIEYIKSCPLENNTITQDHIKTFLTKFQLENPFMKSDLDSE
jgi:hypothetical protein